MYIVYADLYTTALAAVTADTARWYRLSRLPPSNNIMFYIIIYVIRGNDRIT